MPLISSLDAPTFALDQLTVVGLASPSRHAVETSVWRLSLAPGAEGAEHSVDREEIFVALAGSAEFVLDGSVVSVTAGDALVVPASTPFRVRTQGCGDVRGGLRAPRRRDGIDARRCAVRAALGRVAERRVGSTRL